jgi:predicted CXXCH cytochrome family protein
MRKRLVLLAVMTVALIIALTPGVAMANFSIHGGYEMDTDACAGCHRAHTAASSITWTNGAASGSALLLSTASEIYEFCYTCHDAAGQGADTNVEQGIYEGTTYGSNPTKVLNGGGFSDVEGFTTSHMYNGASWFPYGGSVTPDLLGNLSDTTAPQIEMTCSTCHDVHGSSNYRLLKDLVNGNAVGGYTGDPLDPTPTPWVTSHETNYPQMGWLLHEPGASQMTSYTPDYTTPKYAKPASADEGMAGWCGACHVQYMNDTGAEPTWGAAADVNEGYDSLDGFGAAVRHRHPVNVPLTNFLGQRSLIVTDNPLPLLHDAANVATQDSSDWIDCMTCHVAHGSSVTMEGYANVADSTNPDPDSGTGGVSPTGSNALLRMNNRGVCEVCHNK